MSLVDRIRRSQVWKSVFRHPLPQDRRTQSTVMHSNVVLHLHPVSIDRQAVRFGFTWCMGGITLLLFLVEAVTGVLLMFYYRPTTQWAYLDMLGLRDVVSLGILRELHRWAGHAMVITVMLHMLRVFLTGSYKPPREFNWVLGVGLLVLTFLLSFTGYLLPWDQLAYWATTVSSKMAAAAPLVGAEGPGQAVLGLDRHSDLRFVLLGSSEIGDETLNRFYVLHCVALPLVAAALMTLHFWRVRKDGISGPL